MKLHTFPRVALSLMFGVWLAVSVVVVAIPGCTAAQLQADLPKLEQVAVTALAGLCTIGTLAFPATAALGPPLCATAAQIAEADLALGAARAERSKAKAAPLTVAEEQDARYRALAKAGAQPVKVGS